MTNWSSPDPARSYDALAFGRRLRRVRMARRWSQLVLARRMAAVAAGHGGSTTVEALEGMIVKWERGKKGVSPENVHLLAEALETTAVDLGLSVDPDFVRAQNRCGSSDAPIVSSRPRR